MNATRQRRETRDYSRVGNWSALHSDELEDPNLSEYFFRHLQAKKPHIVNFVDYNCDAVRNWLKDYRYP